MRSYGFACLAAVALLALPLGAEPRKLGLDDLTDGQQKDLWQRIDDDAGYAALLKLCHREQAFERRIVEAARPCVEQATVDTVVAFYRSRYASVLAHANPRPCDDPVFAGNHIADKLVATLDAQVSQVRTLCEGYRRDGMAGHR